MTWARTSMIETTLASWNSGPGETRILIDRVKRCRDHDEGRLAPQGGA